MKSKVRIAPKPAPAARDPLLVIQDVHGRLEGIAQGLREHHDEFSPDPTDSARRNAVGWLYTVLLDNLDREIKAFEGQIEELCKAEFQRKAMA